MDTHNLDALHNAFPRCSGPHTHERQTRSGAVFAAWLPDALQGQDFNFAPLVSRAVEVESDAQEDHEPDDDLDDVDKEWPPNPLSGINEEWPLPDPFNDVDNLPLPPPRRKRPASPSYDDLLATGKPLKNKHRRRAAKRVRTIAQNGYTPRASTIAEQVMPAVPIEAPFFDTAALPTAHGAYGAKVESKGEKYGSKKPRSLVEPIGLGFRLVNWDRITPRPLVDAHGHIFMVLGGRPDGDSYRAAVAHAFNLIKDEGHTAQFPASMRVHRRGLFVTINVGLTFGKGQTVPTWLDRGDYASLTQRLLANKDIIRMANFASAAFALWAPVRTFKHRNVCNLPFGWCAVQAPGNFDATKGGHLILWDLKLVVEFPAGALILLPSATIAHSNVPVQDGDECISFTQFTVGGLFCYVDNNFQTQAEVAGGDPVEYERLMQLKETRWEEGSSTSTPAFELKTWDRRRASIEASDVITKRKYAAKAALAAERYHDRKREEERAEWRATHIVQKQVRKHEEDTLRKKHKPKAPAPLRPVSQRTKAWPPVMPTPALRAHVSHFATINAAAATDDDDSADADSDPEPPHQPLKRPTFVTHGCAQCYDEGCPRREMNFKALFLDLHTSALIYLYHT
ncbi:hypothetical protein B0H13DRAFT_2349172 [Mycena leptocephala]|nr:hypothetical protein B0H13DRAFT_2349172 [Mycena leptocephala]